MTEAIWEMEREEEESGQTPSKEDNGGTKGQRRVHTEATWTRPPAENNGREDGGRHATTAGTAGRQQSSDEHHEARGN